MKQETVQNKLLDLLASATGQDLSHLKADPKAKTKSRNDKIVGIPEDRIQSYRQMQGIIYFLQAPRLFEAKICKHCGEGFLVSRQNVAFCSYTCIRLSLEEIGIKCQRVEVHDIDEPFPSPKYIDDIYDGNEPIWIRNIDLIESMINKVRESK